MNDLLFLVLVKGHAVFLLLIKISLLLKYFLFMKYKSPEWKVHHLVYIAESDIIFSDYRMVKVKKLQNSLSFSIVHLIALVMLIRLTIMIFN